jgi:ABC-type antimicrobial peptide transport system permease subunit
MSLLHTYFVLGLRALRRDKVASSINLVGLSAAVACAIALFLLLQEINGTDDFHEHGDRIFLVGHTTSGEEGLTRWGTAPASLGPAAAADLPGVERAVRVARHPATVQAGETAFHETLTFADPGFFDVLTFPLAQGSGASLTDPSAVILSAELATKYFGTADAVGQTLAVTLAPADAERREAEVLTVAGVAAPFPPEAGFRFELLVGYDWLRAAGLAQAEGWTAFPEATFLLLQQPGAATAVAEQLERYVGAQRAAAGEVGAVDAFFLDSVQHPDWWTAWQIEDRAMQAPLVWESVMFGVIALLILLVACFNYVTISLGSAVHRLREIGVRKSIGAGRGELVRQFLAEGFVLCALSVLGGIVLAGAVTVPFLNGLLHRPAPLDLADAWAFWPVLAGLPLFLGLVAGSYPALYASSFQPIAILRGRARLTERRVLTRVLTVGQFVLALVTMCLALFTASLDEQLLGGDWGYDPANLLVVGTGSPDHYDWLRREAARLPAVRDMAGAAQPLGTAPAPVAVRVGRSEQEAALFAVGPDYLEAVGVRAVAGRAFGAAFSADSAVSVVVNQTFADQQRWTDPIGEQVQIDGQTRTVVGVVEDFLLAPMAGSARPALFTVASASAYRSLTLRVDGGATADLDAALRTRWEERFPGVAFASYPQSEVFARESLGGVSRFITSLALFALLISCMGLFGLASQRASGRQREVGVRKAMGASAGQIVLLVNRSFLTMLGLATLIATPLCYLGLSAVLAVAPVDVSLGAAPFVLSNAVVFLLAACTLAWQTNALVQIRPAEVLRS